MIQGLKAELAAQESNQRLVLARLEREKDSWFSTGVTGRVWSQWQGGRGHSDREGVVTVTGRAWSQ